MELPREAETAAHPAVHHRDRSFFGNGGDFTKKFDENDVFNDF